MPADEVTHGTEVDTSRVRTGPRHAAPKKPLFTRFQMPAGKAIALAAMPTAVLMGMGFTPTLAQADSDNATKPTANSLTADEYKDCVAALEDDASASPSPSASAGASDGEEETAKPDPSDSADPSKPSDSSGSSDSSDSSQSAGGSSSSDSGSDDDAEPAPKPSESKTGEAPSGQAATPSPSPSESSGNLLEGIGDAIEGIFTGGSKAEESTSPTPTPSASATEEASSGSEEPSAKETPAASGTVKDTTDKVTDTVKKTVEDAGDKASDAAEDASDAVRDAADEATATPSPSESAGADLDDCPVATDDEGGVDNTVPLPDDPWYLNASSLLLKGADYQGVVEVKTASGKKKKVLKYVISDGTDIGDLHQTVNDKQSGKTYHVQAAKGSTSTIRDGKTVMYTESISGNLLGLIPVTFDPDNPPPLNIPLIYFTKVKVTQAAQFGGTLHVPGLHNYITD
ncbi:MULTISPECIES: hypothetical protein [unclassified Streptomyces]|uniref:hypothetical protein n=1 Tax=unclassified Streptomyces TaxID=2593676 RepID=UPI00074B1F71|nr:MULTISPECIES: hypothetical protein [unclassified Streptomyces]KUL76159.1 hypothetical protein ADL34_13025 [Streptomyces sp. NRRL WC-3605]KUL77214.1 hypothetical protein ADL33_11235 [Streptomyces sp. NRRL WC-3604]